MDPRKNPFAPGAGYSPPELAGRSEILERAEVALGRLKDNKPTKGLLLVGLRGVGKTVVLNHIQDAADADGVLTVMIECVDEKRLENMLIPPLRSLLFKLDRMEGISDQVKKGLRVLKGFMSRVKLKYGDIEMSLDVAAEEGVADSGDLEADLPELLTSLGQAAVSRNVAIALIFDEMQYLGKRELGAVIMAMHKVSQKRLPVSMFGAGLPPLLGHMGNSKSYAE
jgi:Cdc6-like AAA superfamily ATPase